MIRVGVGDEHGGQVRRRQPQLRQGGGDPPAGDAGVQQQMALPAGEDQRVPGGAAGERM